MVDVVAKYRPPEDRAQDFEPARVAHIPPDVAKMAEACAGCHGSIRCVDPSAAVDVSIVTSGCPIGRNIPAFNKLAGEGDFQGAFRGDWGMGHYMGFLTGTLCPATHATGDGSYCMTTCIHSLEFPAHENPQGSVDIPSLEAVVHKHAIDEGWLPSLNPEKIISDKSVGYIGDGAASFYIAANVMQRGHGFSMYGRGDRPGGVVAEEIVGFKIDQHYVDAYFDHLQKNEGDIHTNTNVGQVSDERFEHNMTMNQLVSMHDVLVFGIGKHKEQKATLEGNAADAQISYKYLLHRQIDVTTGKKPANENFNVKDQVVAVQGAGETAMDCVRTLLRNGAKKVYIHYYKNQDAIKSDDVDRKLAVEEGGLNLEGPDGEEIRALMEREGFSEDLAGGRIEFVFQSQITAQDHATDGQGYSLTYDHHGETKSMHIDMPLVVATGARVQSPQEQFGIPDHLVSKAGHFIVDKMPVFTVRANNTNIVAAGLVCIFETQAADGQTRYVPAFALGDCVSDSNGKNSPAVLVHAFAGAMGLKRRMNALLADSKMAEGYARQFPELVVKL